VFAIFSSLVVFAKMLGVQEINMADSHESKLDAILIPKGQSLVFGPFLKFGQAIVDAIFVQKISNFQ
jgi:hypothetical protein